MSHFHIENDNLFFVKGDSGDQKLPIRTGNRVTIQQWGGADPTGVLMPKLYSNNPPVAEVSVSARVGIDQSLTVEAKAAGKAVLNGKDGAGTDCVWPLPVVVGDFTNHSSMEVDLLADQLGRSSNASRIYALQRMLYSNVDSVFNQNSPGNLQRFPGLACGSVCQNLGTTFFSNISLAYQGYHIAITRGSISGRSDIKYDAGNISRRRMVIRALLKGGTVVRVGVTDGPSTAMLAGNGFLQPDRGGGHFVLIVGCNVAADQFLYVDPWYGGSQLAYGGGIAGESYPGKCQMLGMFIIDNGARGPVICQSPASEGSFNRMSNSFLEVIAGP